MGRYRRQLTTLSLVPAAVAMAVAGCSSSGSAAARDVSIASCTASPTGGHPTASGQLINHSSRSSAYTIHVKFTDSAGNGVGDGVAVVGNVAPGSTANWHADGSLNAKGPLQCKVASVTRNARP